MFSDIVTPCLVCFTFNGWKKLMMANHLTYPQTRYSSDSHDDSLVAHIYNSTKYFASHFGLNQGHYSVLMKVSGKFVFLVSKQLAKIFMIFFLFFLDSCLYALKYTGN